MLRFKLQIILIMAGKWIQDYKRFLSMLLCYLLLLRYILLLMQRMLIGKILKHWDFISAMIELELIHERSKSLFLKSCHEPKCWWLAIRIQVQIWLLLWVEEFLAREMHEVIWSNLRENETLLQIHESELLELCLILLGILENWICDSLQDLHVKIDDVLPYSRWLPWREIMMVPSILVVRCLSSLAPISIPLIHIWRELIEISWCVDSPIHEQFLLVISLLLIPKVVRYMDHYIHEQNSISLVWTLPFKMGL